MTIKQFIKQELERMLKEHPYITMQEMANSLGVTKQSIKNWLGEYGLKTAQQELQDLRAK